MRLFAFAIVLGTSFLCGQDRPADVKQEAKPEAWEAVIIPVKTLSGDSFNRLANLLEVFEVHFKADSKLRTIVVYAPKDVVVQMRRVVEELDRPGSEAAVGRNIEMTLTFLRCSTKPPTEPHALPTELEAVARQLRAATQYKDVQIWESVPLHLQEGRETIQNLRLPGAQSSAQVILRPEAIGRKESGRYVRFAQVKLELRIPSNSGRPTELMNVSVDTAGDFMEGQKTVLGKISGIDDESAIFAVIALKVLD